MRLRAAALLALPLAAPAAAELPPTVRAMIESAFATNDATGIAAVVRAAKATNPGDSAEIDGMVNARGARLAAAQDARREGASFFEFVTGNLEFGASLADGNTESLGIYGSVRLTQNSPHWRHQFTARADYLRTNGDTTTDRVGVAYEPNYKFDDRLYAYGLAQYERDPILGYASRYTLGGGVGYAVVKQPRLRIDLTGGPALRQTNYELNGPTTALAGRATMAVRWQITPTSAFSQDAAFVADDQKTSATSTTAVDTQLIGRLKARLSYNLQYERDAPTGVDPVDTVARATLLYGF